MKKKAPTSSFPTKRKCPYFNPNQASSMSGNHS